MHLSIVYKLCFKEVTKNCFPKMQSAWRQRTADLLSAQVIKNIIILTNTFFHLLLDFSSDAFFELPDTHLYNRILILSHFEPI